MKNIASAGNRTRIYCLEGNNANLYTTDAHVTKEGNIKHYSKHRAYEAMKTRAFSNVVFLYSCLIYKTLKCG